MSLLPIMIWLNIPFSPPQGYMLPAASAPQAVRVLQAAVSMTG
jgi:hypothetical protein